MKAKASSRQIVCRLATAVWEMQAKATIYKELFASKDNHTYNTSEETIVAPMRDGYTFFSWSVGLTLICMADQLTEAPVEQPCIRFMN